jgi:hypothetical protein
VNYSRYSWRLLELRTSLVCDEIETRTGTFMGRCSCLDKNSACIYQDYTSLHYSAFGAFRCAYTQSCRTSNGKLAAVLYWISSRIRWVIVLLPIQYCHQPSSKRAEDLPVAYRLSLLAVVPRPGRLI